MIPGLLCATAFPILARAAQEDEDRTAFALQSLADVGLVLGTAAGLTLALAARPVILFLAGQDFEPSIPVLQIQAAALPATFLVSVWATGLWAVRGQRRLAIANCVGVATAVTLSAIAGPTAGAQGVAVAMLVAEWLLAALYLIALVRQRPGLRPAARRRAQGRPGGGAGVRRLPAADPGSPARRLRSRRLRRRGPAAAGDAAGRVAGVRRARAPQARGESGMNPSMEAEFTKYETRGAYHWREIAQRRPDRYSARLHALYSWFVDEVKARQPALLLDIGCGDAALTDLMARATPGRVVGIEPEPSGRAVRARGARGRPVPGGGDAGPRRGAAVRDGHGRSRDDVRGGRAHGRRRAACAARSARVLAPAGALLVSTPQWQGPELAPLPCPRVPRTRARRGARPAVRPRAGAGERAGAPPGPLPDERGRRASA